MESQSKTAQDTQFFSPALRLLIIGLLFITAFGIRLYNINGMPKNLHPGRPYNSIIIARAYYFETSKSIPQWRREVARVNKNNRPFQEPRIIEHIAAFTYRIAGGEYLWIPRILFSIFWLTGGFALYLLAKKITSPHGAMLSIAFYLFLPYAVSASRSFHPHSLMIMILILSWLTIFQYYQQPSMARAVFAGTCSGLTLFTYPHSIFPILGAFSCLAIYKYGFYKAIANLKSLVFVAITLAPVAIWYGLVARQFIRWYGGISFTPGLLMGSFFWKGWYNQLEYIIGFAALIGALLGAFLPRKGLGKALLTGLWLGYLVYVLIFNYQNATHTYYQIVLIPIVGLSLAPIGALIGAYLDQTCTRWRCRLPVLVIILLALFINIHRVKQQLINRHFEREVKIAKEIGEAVRHSTKTILLTRFHKSPFQYHGELSGWYWPKSGDFRAQAMRGERILSAEERFKGLSAQHEPEYFIVTDFQEFLRQPDLQGFLTKNFTVLARTRDYLLYDLRVYGN